jgi:hypothetical protein
LAYRHIEFFETRTTSRKVYFLLDRVGASGRIGAQAGQPKRQHAAGLSEGIRYSGAYNCLN